MTIAALTSGRWTSFMVGLKILRIDIMEPHHQAMALIYGF
jgi:hypothetical protein